MNPPFRIFLAVVRPNVEQPNAIPVISLTLLRTPVVSRLTLAELAQNLGMEIWVSAELCVHRSHAGNNGISDDGFRGESEKGEGDEDRGELHLD